MCSLCSKKVHLVSIRFYSKLYCLNINDIETCKYHFQSFLGLRGSVCKWGPFWMDFVTLSPHLMSVDTDENIIWYKIQQFTTSVIKSVGNKSLGSFAKGQLLSGVRVIRHFIIILLGLSPTLQKDKFFMMTQIVPSSTELL